MDIEPVGEDAINIPEGPTALRKRFRDDLRRAVLRARIPILTIAATYAVSVLAGMIMVHEGNTFALGYRDQLVGSAVKEDAAMIASIEGKNLEAAIYDFGGNLILGSVPKTVMGFGVVFPYPWVAFQGWVGGIVSVRGDHSSRLTDVRPAAYYFLTLVLQLAAYSLAVGGGVNVGVSLFRPGPYYRGEKFARLFPKEVLRDLLRIYALVIPIFFVASIWEFLSPWNF